MKRYGEVLRRCPLFLDIREEGLPSMLGCLGAAVQIFEKKEIILAEGEPADRIGILLSGEAQIARVDYDGNRSILSHLGASELFGEAFACAQMKTVPVTVVANERCEVMLIDSARILHTCQNHCDFHQQLIVNLMKNLAQKTVLFQQKIEVTSKRTTREKLLTYLSQQAKKAGTPSFDIPFDRQGLADYLEVERSGLSAVIGKLSREGVLRTRKRHFTLLQRDTDFV